MAAGAALRSPFNFRPTCAYSLVVTRVRSGCQTGTVGAHPAAVRPHEKGRADRRDRFVLAARAAVPALAGSGDITGYPAKIATVDLSGYKLQTFYPLGTNTGNTFDQSYPVVTTCQPSA